MSVVFRDFDAARRGRAKITFKFNGKPRILPSSPNAAKMLAFQAYDRQTTPAAEAQRLLEDLFDGLIGQLQREPGTEYQDITDLVTWALHKWGIGTGLPEDQSPEQRMDELTQQLNKLSRELLDLSQRSGVIPKPMAAALRAMLDALPPPPPEPEPETPEEAAVPKSRRRTSSGSGRR